MIDDHDYEVKMRSMKRFFEEGDKVKITLRFRGREMAHQELGYKLLKRVKDDTAPDRQGRIGAALRRPPDGDAAGAALARNSLPSSQRAARRSRAALSFARRSASQWPAQAPLVPAPRQVPAPALADRWPVPLAPSVAELDADLDRAVRRDRAGEIDDAVAVIG